MMGKYILEQVRMVALGIVVKSPQRGLELRAGKARTCNGTPGPQATPKFINK